MPRRARLMLPNVPLHLIQRGNNRQVCFVAEEDYRFYLDWLKNSNRGQTTVFCCQGSHGKKMKNNRGLPPINTK
jgi:REP element-mobilizing transposase RayT